MRFPWKAAMPNASPAPCWREPEVMPIGLGARDSLRLEAGLCLYGHDMDETMDPVEANLVWSIGKRRKTEGGFAGADIVLDKLLNGVGQETGRHSARRPRPGARRHRDRCETARSSARSPPAASAPA